MPRPRRETDDDGRLCCTGCDEWKRPAAFSPAPTTSGRASRCKVCKAADIRAYRLRLARLNRITSAKRAAPCF